MDRLVVLGGSSPFTAGLVDALVEAEPPLPPYRLVLQGRSRTELELVARYAASRLSSMRWEVGHHTDPATALNHATIVIQQNRYGGFPGRQRDEAFAVRFGIPPDETLGPAALLTLVRTVAQLRSIGALLKEICPGAWVLNLTNPLSVATTLLADSGVDRCLGVCELPRVTALRAAQRVDRSLASIDWRYTGLNHRGFIVRFHDGTRDLIPELVRRLGTAELEGVSSAEIEALGAIPTKYFRLLRGDSPAQVGRALEVRNVRRRIRAELARAGRASPPSLRERYLAWYPQAVVPLVRALGSEDGENQVVNRCEGDGICREQHGHVSRAGVRTLFPPPIGPEVARWIEHFERHERAVIEFARAPGRSTARRAVEADPLVPATVVGAIVRELCAEA